MGSNPKFLSRRGSFLKALDDDCSMKLTIPPTFIRNFSGDIPRWFVLEIAGTRKGYRVDIEADGNSGFCFNYGWNEFKKDQSLQVGDFLLFEYEEPLILQVKIFQKDGTEKTNGTNIELQCQVEGSEWRKQSPKKHHDEEADLWCTRPSNQYEGHEKFQDIANRIQMETDYGHGLLEKECEVDDTNVFETDDQCKVHKMWLDDFEGIERGTGKVFATEEGVCYIVAWRKAPHLYYYLTIPKVIINAKMISSDETVILKDQKGSTWPMKVRSRPSGRVDLVQGWKEFLIENDVRNGDILTFKFASDKVIQIHIERAIERFCEIDPPFGSDCPTDPKRAFPIDAPFERAFPLDHRFERANKREPLVAFDNACEEPDVNYTSTDRSVPETRWKSEKIHVDGFTKSSFSVTWKNSRNYSSYLHIPKAIARQQNLKNKDTVLLCDSDGTQWLMQIRTRPSDGRFLLGQGWSTYWRQLNIGYGDTLNFKFVSSRVMKVNIIKALAVHPPFSESLSMKQEVMQLE